VCAITDPSQKERKNKLKASELKPKQGENKTQPLVRKGLRKRKKKFQAEAKKTHRSAMLEQWKWSRKKGA